jgi:hypothetical protein
MTTIAHPLGERAKSSGSPLVSLEEEAITTPEHTLGRAVLVNHPHCYRL